MKILLKTLTIVALVLVGLFVVPASHAQTITATKKADMISDFTASYNSNMLIADEFEVRGITTGYEYFSGYAAAYQEAVSMVNADSTFTALTASVAAAHVSNENLAALMASYGNVNGEDYFQGQADAFGTILGYLPAEAKS